MIAQLRLPLSRAPDFSRGRFVASPANAAAVAMVDGHRSGALALIGPEGSGKTHLAHVWAEDKGARFLTGPGGDVSPLHGQRLAIENAEAWGDDEGLFHLLNMAQSAGALLLTSRLPPLEWAAALPDLRSRLNGLTIAELGEVDEAALASALAALFDERSIRPADDVIPYLLWRMERSVRAARSIVERLDEAAASRGREINRALAIEVLGDAANGDLFG